MLHATDHPSQQSRRYGVLPGHSASQAGCASRHVTPITVVQAVRCPSRAFGEPGRILLHNPHVTAVPVVNWQGQDEMCCPVCCSPVTLTLRRLHAYPGPWCQRLAELLSAWCRCLLTRPRRLTCYGLLISPPIFCDGRPVLLYAEGATAFQAEPYFVSDVVPMVRVFAADWCTTCGRPRVAQVIVVAVPRLGCHSPRARLRRVQCGVQGEGPGVSLSSTAGGVAPACSAWCHAALGNRSVCARTTSGTAAGRPVHVASAVL